MDFNPLLSVTAFGIGIVVGLTGMGGGALMTPVLVLLFGIHPLAAVSSDLVASAVMKPVGSLVHLRRGTVNRPLVRWLCVGSVPAAFTGVLLARLLGDSDRVQQVIQIALGVALLAAAAGLAVRGYLRLVERARAGGRLDPPVSSRSEIRVRPLATVVVGVVGGLVVGLTSVGSGSLIIIALMALYPGLLAKELVGTDLVQAVPLVMSAAVGHLLFGDFQLNVTAALLLGSIPGVWVGARLSSRAPGGLIRRALAFVLLASALKLLGVSTLDTGLILAAVLIVAPLIWMMIRTRHGLEAMPWSTPAAVRAAGPLRSSGERGPQQEDSDGAPAGAGRVRLETAVDGSRLLPDAIGG